MQEPLLWNPLPDAAAWLSQKTGRAIDARALLDIVASTGKEGDPTPTIIKTLLPRDAKFAVVAMFENSERSEHASITHNRLTREYGALPAKFSYIGDAYPRVEPLCTNFVLDLLLYGHTEIALITHGGAKGPHHSVWLMPWGASHTATVDTCGINRDDLIALGEALAGTNAGNNSGDHFDLRDDGQPKDWRQRAEQLAPILWDDRIRGGYKPTKEWLIQELSAQLRNEEYCAERGGRLSNANVQRTFVNGWSPPPTD